MTTRRYLMLLALVLILASCTSRTGGDISTKGNIVEIKAKDLRVKALKGATEEGVYVLMSAHAVEHPPALSYLDGKLTVLPKEDYELLGKLRANPDPENRNKMRELRKKVRRLAVIAEDAQTQKKIQELIQKAKRQEYPVVAITMTEILVMELKYQGKPIYMKGEAAKNHLVSKIKVL